MNWLAIGIICAVSLFLRLNWHFYTKFPSCYRSDPTFEKVCLALFVFPLAELLVFSAVVVSIFMLALAFQSLGIINVVVSLCFVLIITLLPKIIKPLTLSLFVGVPYRLKAWKTNWELSSKVYKQDLEVRVPIKRSVYDIISDNN